MRHALLGTIIALLSAGAWAGDPPAVADAVPPVPRTLPSLDELLRLKTPTPTPDQPAGVSEELRQELSGAKPSDAFKQAIGLMERSVERLDKGQDPGVQTQRLQEDTIRKLDYLISQAKKSQNQQSGGKPQNGDQSQPQPGQSQQSQQAQGQQQAAAGSEPDQGDRPGLSGQQLRPGLDAARSAWGQLPERLRRSLLQGSGEKFSQEYQQWTEEYYRKLGEKPE